MRRPNPLPPADPAAPIGDWLTTTEVAALLRVHPKHVYRLLHQGMPARRVGGQWRFSHDAISQWAARRRDVFSTPSEAPVDSIVASGPSLVAVEPNEIADALVSLAGASSSPAVALVPTRSRRAAELLASGQVAAAVIRHGDAPSVGCATVRMTLGERQIGVLGRAELSSPEAARSMAVPPLTQAGDDGVAVWLRAAPPRGIALHPAGSELDACARVLRQESDAAIGARVWARRLGLRFHPLHTERWELAVRVDAMEDPNVAGLCTAIQGDALRASLSEALECAVDAVGQMRLERGAQPGPDRYIAAGDDAAADEPPGRSRTSVRWAVLIRDRADQMLGLVQELRDRGLRVGGFVQVPSGPASAKPLGYDLYRLNKPERAPLAERIRHDQLSPSGDRFCELSFHASTLARACEWLREDVSMSDLLIVDGVGRLETRGQGLFPALAWARTQSRPKLIILSSRRAHVPDVARRLSLSDKQVTELSFGSQSAAPQQIVEQIVRACGRTPRARPSTPRPE